MPIRVNLGHSGIKCSCKCGKRAGRCPARSVSREPNEESKGPIDHTLLVDLTSPSLVGVPRGVSGVNDLCKGRYHFAVLSPVKMKGSEDATTPKRAPGSRVPAQPFKPLGQFSCPLLDISKQGVVIGAVRSAFGCLITCSRALESGVKPSRRLFVRWRDASESQQIQYRGRRA